VVGVSIERALPTTFLELMDLEQIAADFFVGQSPDYPWGRVFGGQVVAQSLRAAASTVNPEHRVHSLHAYFLLAGTVGKPILFEVERLRDGRSFSTRRVVARQDGGVILNIDLSFQRDEPEVDIQETNLADDIPKPDQLPPSDWGAMGVVRDVPNTPGSAVSRIWMKVHQELQNDPILHACGLAYLSDHNPLDAIILSHPSGGDWESMMTASLDHAIWFHRQPKADDWMLFDMRGHGLTNARGMATGAIHSIGGVHLATVAQEGLVRSPRTLRQ
jgi:acyl-CoA thioesterase II